MEVLQRRDPFGSTGWHNYPFRKRNLGGEIDLYNKFLPDGQLAVMIEENANATEKCREST